MPEQDHGVVFDATNVILAGGDPEFVESPDVALTAFLEAGGALAGLMTRLATGRLEAGRPTRA